MDIGLAYGARQFDLSNACPAFDTGVRGFASELNGVATGKRCFFKDRNMNIPVSQTACSRQSRYPGTNDGDVFVVEVQRFTPTDFKLFTE